MKIFVATHNAHKLREIAAILSGYEIVADDPAGAEETAADFAGNALIKVRAIAARHEGEWCLADDSGLEVQALGGAPGVGSARYAGEPTDTAANNALLLKNLQGMDDRRANFTCAVALVDPNGVEHVVQGRCFGRIACSPSGAAGFGYDPLFVPDGGEKSFAELSAAEKNAISHRARALVEARSVIERLAAPRRGKNVSAWLRFFRVVNLPTVPGDVLAGGAAALAGAAAWSGGGLGGIAWAAAASVFWYLFGLADNDIVGASTDRDRPVPSGEISLRAARLARGLCWGGVLAVGAACPLPPRWWMASMALFIAIVVYNRTKHPLLMGLCRGLNVVCGAMAAVEGGFCVRQWTYVLAVAGVWMVYIAAVTKYSEGEERDPFRKATVGMLVGALVYLQLGALVVFTLMVPQLRWLLVAGAVLLVALRIAKLSMPKVSAS